MGFNEATSSFRQPIWRFGLAIHLRKLQKNTPLRWGRFYCNPLTTGDFSNESTAPCVATEASQLPPFPVALPNATVQLLGLWLDGQTWTFDWAKRSRPQNKRHLVFCEFQLHTNRKSMEKFFLSIISPLLKQAQKGSNAEAK